MSAGQRDRQRPLDREDGGRALLARHAHRLQRDRAAASRTGTIDALRATFPAGTVSGAPKIRAMEIIDELEPVKRGVYAGAVGYLSWSGNMDTAIAIRTAVIKDGFARSGRRWHRRRFRAGKRVGRDHEQGPRPVPGGGVGGTGAGRTEGGRSKNLTPSGKGYPPSILVAFLVPAGPNEPAGTHRDFRFGMIKY